MALLKEASISSNRIWKAADKPKQGPISNKRQSCRLKYKMITMAITQHISNKKLTAVYGV